MKLILFDVDGTLIDSQAIIHESMRQTFLHFGYSEPELESTKSIIGLTLDRAIATILQRNVDDEVLAMTAEYKDAYVALAQKDEMQSMPFHGIPSLIHRLSNRSDITLGVVTGKSRRGVQRLFQTTHFADRFTVSRCADDCPSKPHPAMVRECCEEIGISPFNTVVIGDTGFDMEMAKAAGANSIGVSWGYHPVERMYSAGAEQVVHCVSSLEDALFSFLGPVKKTVETPRTVASLASFGSL
jgi:phosphoglycolate phosphatase